MKLAPICLFTYNRLNETKQTVAALQCNFLAKESDLFIFSDGGKDDISKEKVAEVRKYIKNITGFKSIKIIASPTNKGLANSIISGVSQIIEEYEKVIVLEDDLITAPNFLDFMNQALDFYEKEASVFSISGYTMDLPSLKTLTKDYYLGVRASSWGWGTWKNRWQDVDWEVSDSKMSLKKRFKFMQGGSDLPRMLKKQLKGKIDSWAIRWCYHQFNKNLYTIFPKESKLISVGFNDEATHTKKTKRFITKLDITNATNFKFHKNPVVEKVLIKEFKAKFSVLNRLMDRF
ncbi:glycosyltransferase [Lutibacter sp. A64]|uniref:glycosyltransferase n=1 Tax=Lutibacter sp. A64 TaxID=2918526 RepID=UPI001F055AB5|nr:glycosyltransferase [Lutibacter sp. A64]UMB54365.1 glycosyltransferase [Lutibacter sp. A64]